MNPTFQKIRQRFFTPILHHQGEVLVFKTSVARGLPSMAQMRYCMRLFSRAQRWLFWSSLLLFVVSVTTFSTRWYIHATKVVPTHGGTYIEGMVGAPDHITPLLASLSDVDADIASLMFSGLFRYNEKQELIPDIVTENTLSDDHKTYTFHIRQDIHWHDGQALTVDDILFTIATIQDPQYRSPLIASLKGVQTQKIDDYAFLLTLQEPFAPFLSTLTFGIIPQHVWYDVPPQNIGLTDLKIQSIGSGPFEFTELTKDKIGNILSFTVTRNIAYYGDAPYLDHVQFVFYPDETSAIEALISKKIDGLSFIPQSAKENIEKHNDTIQFRALKIPQYTAVFFNQKKSKVLQDTIVRQALARAVNRDEIIQEIFYGEGEAIFTPILPGYIGHNPEVEKYSFDTASATASLESNKWLYPEGANTPSSDGSASVFIPREKDGVKLEFILKTVDHPEYRRTAELLQKHWQEIGMNVVVNYYSPEDVQNQIVKTRDYDALLFGEIVGTDPDPYPFWHSSQQDHPGLGLAIFRDRDVDGLLEEARKTTNVDDRRLSYLHFQNNIAEKVPAIFLYNPLYTYAIHQKVHGINVSYISIPADRFAGIQHWYIKTSRVWK